MNLDYVSNCSGGSGKVYIALEKCLSPGCVTVNARAGKIFLAGVESVEKCNLPFYCTMVELESNSVYKFPELKFKKYIKKR